MSNRFILPFADVGSGVKPPDGAKLFFSETGESFAAEPRDTFSQESASPGQENANPVIADSTGVFPNIWITGRYKVVLTDKNNVQIWEADPVVASDSGREFETVADMIADFGGDAGDMVTTKGYYTAGDIGSGRYLIEAAQPVDEFGDHTLDDGNVAILQKSGLVNAFQYGVLSTADSGPRLKAALDTHTVVRGGGGTFRIDSLVSFDEGQWLIGKGTTVILATSNDSGNATRISIDGINAGVRDAHFTPLGISGATGIVRSPLRITKSNFKSIRNFWEGVDTNARFVDVQAFEGISAGDNYTVTNTQFEANQYTWCSNCIHEVNQYTANNTSIKNEFAYLTPGNYINFNGEKLDPAGGVRVGTSNLHVSGCIAKDIGFAGSLTGDLGNSAERRFLATTLVDNVVVIDNIIDHVYGDSPIHMERPGKFSIADNSFLNCHGSLAKGISIEAGSVGLDGVSGPEWNNPELNGSITGNTFDHRDSDNVSGQDSDDVISMTGAVTFENVDITGNTFVWYEPGMYPQTPSIATVAADSLRAIVISQSRGKRCIGKNRFLNMDVGVQVSNTTEFGASVDENFFRNCEDGIVFGNLAVRPISMKGNDFKDCNNVWTIDEDYPPLDVGGNIVNDCTSALLGILDPNWTQNTYSNVTTIDDPMSENFTITNTGAGTWAIKIVGKLVRRMNGTINVRITRATAGDTRVSNFDYGFREVGEFDVAESYTKELFAVGAPGSIPVIGLTESSGNLVMNLSGGATDFDYFAVVKVSGIVEAN